MMVLTASGSRKAKAVPLIMGDSVEKADIEICKHPSGKGDWLLGTGASGKVLLCWLLSCFFCPVLNLLQPVACVTAFHKTARGFVPDITSVHQSFWCPITMDASGDGRD